jgi:S-adenosylmethionine-diacylglycerol 3-amino-3-carboxypropyl transferase
VTIDGRSRGTSEILAYDRDLAARLHPLDRVHTYGSFFIAELKE